MDPNHSLLCKLADFYSGLTVDTIPAHVMDKTRRSLADFLCEVAAGYHTSELGSVYNSYAKELGGKEEATILCMGAKVPAINAATANGIMGHSIELDDGHRWGTSHPAVAIIPAAMAMGEKQSSTLPEILGAIAIGYDVMLRAARSINPSHLKRGFHSTGTCGTLGAAAACAWLLKLDPKRFAYAISMGGLQSAGLQEMLHDHPGIKPLQPGKAAMAGVLSADLASRGVKSPRTLFEGQHGWMKAMCANEYNEEALIGDLGKRWEITLSYTKLYPTCRHCHAAIDLAREAKRTLSCTDADVASILVRTYSLGIVEVGQIFLPANFAEALFSLPFSVAIALRKGNVVLSDYTQQTLNDPQLRRVANELKIEDAPKQDAAYPEERGAWMKIVLKDGRSFEKGIPVAKGEPENPADDKTIKEKIRAMLSDWYPAEFDKCIWNTCVETKSTTLDDILGIFRRFNSL